MFIIDGTNLLWATRDWAEGPEVTTEEQLCQILNQYFADIRQECQIVFDGTRPSDRNARASARSLCRDDVHRLARHRSHPPVSGPTAVTV